MKREAMWWEGSPSRTKVAPGCTVIQWLRPENWDGLSGYLIRSESSNENTLWSTHITWPLKENKMLMRLVLQKKVFQNDKPTAEQSSWKREDRHGQPGQQTLGTLTCPLGWFWFLPWPLTEDCKFICKVVSVITSATQSHHCEARDMWGKA